MSENELNYEEEIEIDPQALDVEWLDQPRRFLKYSRHEAETKRKLALAHENLKVIRSQLIKEAQEVLAKATAPTIEAYYRDHQKHIEAKQQFIDAEYEANIASSAVFAFQQRKMALENLVRLGGMDYFARPTEPRDLPVEVDRFKKAREADSEERNTKRAENSRQKRRTRGK